MSTPESELESRLQLAATDPAERPAFYRALLDALVYVVGKGPRGTQGAFVAETGESLQIQEWATEDGGKILPFFTSVAALQRTLQAESTYLALPARSLFETTLGTRMVLNPGSPYGKEFFPEEISALLSEGVNQRPQRRVVEKDTQVLMGQPKIRPEAMLQALRALLVKHPVVVSARLALMHDPSRDPKPTLLVGLEVDGDPGSAVREAGVVAGETAGDQGPVDLMVMRPGDGGVVDYLKQVEPFYRRAKAVPPPPPSSSSFFFSS